MPRLELPVVLTLRELAKLMGMSKFRTQSHLREAKIAPRKVGNKFVIYLAQIKAGDPLLYASLEERLRTESLRNYLDQMVEEYEADEAKSGKAFPNPG